MSFFVTNLCLCDSSGKDISRKQHRK